MHTDVMIEAISKVTMGPNDILIFKAGTRMTQKEAKELSAQVKARYPDLKFLIAVNMEVLVATMFEDQDIFYAI
jgi:hypothetical protein